MLLARPMKGTAPAVTDDAENARRASALAQEGVDLEIIVVDDCSPTDLQPALAGFSDPIRYHRMERNGGANRARNEGVRQARGRYVAFLDDDDIWLPHKLERQRAVLESDPTLGGVFCLGDEFLDLPAPTAEAAVGTLLFTI